MATDQSPRSAFAAQVARLAKHSMDRGLAESVTSSGHRVLLSGLFGKRVGAIEITAPGGQPGEVYRRGDGWLVSETGDVAAALWDAMERDALRAQEREKLKGLLSVEIRAVPFAAPGARRETARCRLSPEQWAELRGIAERMSAQHPAD